MREICLWCALAVTLSIAAVVQSPGGQDRAIRDFPQLSADRDWPWWRGPNRNGVGPDAPAPVQFSESSRVVWKTPVPGRGGAPVWAGAAGGSLVYAVEGGLRYWQSTDAGGHFAPVPLRR